MALAQTYRAFIEQLTAGIAYLRAYYGGRLAATIGMYADEIGEALRYTVIVRLPGHVQQTEDALNQVGTDRTLFRYRNESFTSWGNRVRNAWTAYEQAGSAIQVLRAINEWGSIVFPFTWDASKVFLTEEAWADFRIKILPGVTTWLPTATYGSGVEYGATGLVYGGTNIISEDIFTLRAIIKKWKPARSRGYISIIISGHVYGEPGLDYGDAGVVYGNATMLTFEVQ